MQNNTGILIGATALVLVLSLCCVGGIGFAVYGRSMSGSSAPVVTPMPVPAPMPMPVPMPPPSMPSMPPAPMGAPLTVLPTSPVRGPATAAVTMHILSEFQCPFCGRVEPTLAEVMQSYAGRVRFVWHDYPLPFHANAMPAAEAGQEVRRQLGDEAFWLFHDRLFAAQSDLSRPTLEAIAGSMPGLDLARFRRALDTHEHEGTVRSDMALADAVHPGGLGTPTFQIEGQWVVGAQPSSVFHAALDTALAGH